MQVAPAVSDRMPDRPFGERRQMVGLAVDFDWSLGRLRHADNVPIRNPGASPNQEKGVRRQESGARSQQFRPARVKKKYPCKSQFWKAPRYLNGDSSCLPPFDS